MNPSESFNVVILGQKGTGKTSIFQRLHRHIHARYPDDTFQSLNRFAFFNTKATFVVSDANVPPLPTMTRQHVDIVSRADAFIIVYALDDAKSFDYVEAIKDYIISHKRSDVPIIIVGNKNDLSDRTVVDCLVTIDWEMKYIELSALMEDKFPLVLERLLPEVTQVRQIPIGDDLDTFEFQGMTFRQRSCTTPRGMPKSQSNFSLRNFKKLNFRQLSDFPFVNNGDREDDQQQRPISHKRNISLPSFLTRRRSRRE